MKLAKIISLANANSKLRFVAMVRSLRATGCNLPIWVIPYDDDVFELPENCIWWELPKFNKWLKECGGSNMMRKYQCLFTNNYQYVDSDVIFLKNPESILSNTTGFITSCGHWHNPEGTLTKESKAFYSQKTTTWQKKVFNAGQFACDIPLYTFETLKHTAEDSRFSYTCMHSNDQAGMNLFVFRSNINVTNLTLPPQDMESTWAGDYNKDYEAFWTKETMPYIIHWAGCRMDLKRPIDDLMVKYLTKEEAIMWNDTIRSEAKKRRKLKKRIVSNLRRIKQGILAIKFE